MKTRFEEISGEESSSPKIEKEKVIGEGAEYLDAVIEERAGNRLSWLERRENSRKTKEREEGVRRASEYEETLRRLLSRYGIDVPVRKVGRDIFRVAVSENSGFDKLPEGYAYKGGAARAVLLRTFGIDPQAEPRDVDLVRVTSRRVEGLDETLAEEYAPDDLEHGYGVEELENNYFESRDFTINEILVHGDSIYLTKACLLDTVRRIIRFSDFERIEVGGSNDTFLGVDAKLIAKALRFLAEEMALGRKAELADEEVYKFENIEPFHIALHLDRAMERGGQVAVEYVRILRRRKQLPPDIQTPEEAVAYLDRELRASSFVFRFAPERIFETDDEVLGIAHYEKYQEIVDYFDRLPERKSAKSRQYRGIGPFL